MGNEVMKTVEVTKTTQTLADYTRKVKKEPVIITHEGKPVAALISISNVDIETVSLGGNPKFLALIERSRARRKAEGGISAEKMRHRLKKPKRSKIM
jgi:prevent-host-death family protein